LRRLLFKDQKPMQAHMGHSGAGKDPMVSKTALVYLKWPGRSNDSSRFKFRVQGSPGVLGFLSLLSLLGLFGSLGPLKLSDGLGAQAGLKGVFVGFAGFRTILCWLEIRTSAGIGVKAQPVFAGRFYE
jgi:hypothetical protein